MSTVRGLKARGPVANRMATQTLRQDPHTNVTNKPKETTEVGVDTDDLPPVPGPETSNGDATRPTVAPPAIEEVDEGPDTATVFLGAFVSLLFWILKILVTFPLKVLQTVISLFIFSALVSLILLQIKDESEMPTGAAYFNKNLL
jgi:hypothetical protein